MKRFYNSIALFGSIVFLGWVVSCGTARRGEPFQGNKNFAEGSKAAKGMIIYNKNCQPCHPNGETGIGPSLNNKPVPGFLIRRQIRFGLGAMPPFNKSQISETEMSQLLTYIKAFRKKKPSKSVTGKKA
jgi:mono/diheme cytochrome c family protein